MGNAQESAKFAPVKMLRGIYDIIEMLVVAAVITVLVFMFVGRLTVVDGPSMNNTLYDKEVLAVTNLGYTPKPGDIVVFQSPESGIDGAIVKRVIATEGQTVDIDFDNWLVYVDGEPLAVDENGNACVEEYVNYIFYQKMIGEGYKNYPYTVPEGKVFVMGDNRNNSNDSRGSAISAVDTRYIFGKVIFRVQPFNRLGVVK